MLRSPSGTLRFRPIDDDYAVSAQIAPEAVQEIAAAGFRTIMCNRPDGEDPGQPTFAEVAAAAAAAGLAVVHIPVSGGVRAEQVADMQAALADLPKPIFSYCRSGNRCTLLYEAAKDAD